MAKRKNTKGGGAYGPGKLRENNGKREPGAFRKLDPEARASSLATKTTSDGFARGGGLKKKDGGTVSGAAPAPSLAKRARGGRTTSAPFSNVHVPKERDASSESGHEGE